MSVCPWDVWLLVTHHYAELLGSFVSDHCLSDFIEVFFFGLMTSPSIQESSFRSSQSFCFGSYETLSSDGLGWINAEDAAIVESTTVFFFFMLFVGFKPIFFNFVWFFFSFHLFSSILFSYFFPVVKSSHKSCAFSRKTLYF